MKITELEGYELAGRFRLHQLLGKGGYGAVFEAEQLSMGRTCAVKVLVPHLTNDDATVKRFKREARSTSKLAHPHTIVIYDFGLDEDVNLLFLAMEYLHGATLNELITANGPLDVETAIHVLEQAASSLDDAAEAGIVHRDIKPHNIMVTRRGNDDHYVKVIDFGIAKALKGNDPNRITAMELTQTGTIVGTPQYMSPEQIRDESLDGRSDQYSLAICLYKMLTGQTPFTGSSAIDIATRHLTDNALPLTSFKATLPISEEFEAVVFKALSKDRDERFATASEFAAELRRVWKETGPVETAEEPATSDIQIPQDLPTPPSGSIGVAAPSGTFDAEPPSEPADDEEGGETEPVEAADRPGETTTAPMAPDTEPRAAPEETPSPEAAPQLTGAMQPDFESQPPSSPEERQREGVRMAGDLPSLDLPDAPGHTVQIDSLPGAPNAGDTAAIASPSAGQEESDERGFAWPIVAGVAALGLVVFVVVIANFGGDAASDVEVPAGDDPEKIVEKEEPPIEASSETRAETDSPLEQDHEKVAAPELDAGKESSVAAADVDEKVDDGVTAEATEDEEAAAKKEAKEEKVEKGYVKVTIMPWGELWVGRKKYGTDVRQTISLTPGRHRLRLKQNGETRASKTVDVKSGRSTMVLLKAK